MKKIKSFIYLDSNKMYSISSQLFEGLTEYIVSSEKKTEVESTEQKGTIGSGKLMADIMESNMSKSEKKFLHDYSYILFEDVLIKENKVLIIDKNNIEKNLAKIDDYSFVMITNKVIFNDTKMIEKTMTDYNTFGQALTYLSEQANIDKINELNEIVDNIKDRNQKAKAKQILNNSATLKKLAKERGLYLDDEFIKHLTYTLSYGYHGQFEIQVPFKTETIDKLFSAILKRELLLENEINIIKKYSRKTEKSFTVFGVLTQSRSKKEKNEEILNENNDDITKESVGMKKAILNLIDPISNVEELFIGKLDNEYILDPIAVYREI